MPLLVALAGPSRSGKGTGARVFAQEAATTQVSVRERQLSGPGKKYLASAWKPGILEEDAIAWWEEMKPFGPVIDILGPFNRGLASVPLQQYMQRMLQGARTIFGDDAWTDLILPLGPWQGQGSTMPWMTSFMVPDDRFAKGLAHRVADLCIISDLRQESEARRVRELGGVVVEFVRPVNDDSYRTGKDHVTEQRLPPELVDFTINNTSTLQVLEQTLQALYYHDLLPRIANA